MNIFADENIAHSLVLRLRADGHHVECMADVAMGSPDTDVLTLSPDAEDDHVPRFLEGCPA